MFTSFPFALVASIIQNVLGSPLLLLQRAYGAPGSVLGTVLALLRTPFPKAATLVGLLGSLVGTGLLLEGFAADKARDFVNSVLHSSSPSSNDSIDPSHLLYLESDSYVLTLETLFSHALSVPVQPPDAPPFPAAEVRGWEEASEVLRGKMERGMERVASGWVDVLEWLSPLADGDEESVEVERERRTTYLSAVLDELEAVNSRRPTRFVYLPETAFTDAGVESEEERLREVERQEREKKEAEFEEWVESIMGVAGSQARRGEEGADEEDAREKRRRMLDQPMGGGGETFRKALRTQWDAMYDSSKGGVMGNVAREWGNIAAKYGGDEDKKHAEEGLPEPVQIMAAHHLRSQLSATLDLLRPRDSRFAYRKNEEAEILPPSMRGMTEEYMHVFQRAVKIDQRARRWADSLLDVLVPSSRLPSRVKPRQLDFKSRIHLLRASPLPSFLKSLNELFKLPSDPAHWRPSLSKHDLSNALFSLQEKALQGKVGEEARGGCSAVLRERERRRVGEEGRKWVKERLDELRRAEGTETRSEAGRDEL